MAHSTNRSTDFAPSWLKLPEQNQEQRRGDSAYNSSNSSHYTGKQSRVNTSLIVNTNSINNSGVHSSHHQPFSNTAHHTNSHISSSHHSPLGSANSHHYRSGRPQLNSYHSGYNGRPSLSGPSSTQQHSTHLQRSQSTGSYNDSITRGGGGVSTSSTATTNPPPLEEDFPVLRSGPSTAPAQPNHFNKTAQWRIQGRAKDDSNNKGGSSNAQPDNLLTGNMSSSKVYRAQVKTVKRSNIISTSNGGGVASVPSDIPTTSKENGDDNSPPSHSSLSKLSSSLDKEKKFLQELGWKESAESDEDCGIPEQDPAELQYIMQEAKAARQRLLQNCQQNQWKHGLTPAVLPNEDDIVSSSSDNSDTE